MAISGLVAASRRGSFSPPFASAFILYALVFGVQTARKVVPDWVVRTGIALGGLIFGGTGLISLFKGANYLDYSALKPDPVAGQHIGILLVELGVGITVASVMTAIFFAFASRRGGG
jgi:multicomponent Na+:H+ antiporter subunit B